MSIELRFLRSILLIGLLTITGMTPPTLQAQPPAPEADTVTAAAERFRPDRIDWQPCPQNPAVECGTLTLPVDYENPYGETFELAVARLRATDPSRRIGLLFTNPGGPGLSGVTFLNTAVAFAPVFAPYRERFDIISFDPRGVGGSRSIQCIPGSIDVDPEADDATLIAAFDDFSRTYVNRCLESDGDFIRHLSTNNAARDMDMIRRALGERQITYAAGSYGTQLGAVYASLYPRRVRAMALDGGIAPAFSDYYVEMTVDQLEGFELELQRIDVLCRRDPACRLATTGVVAGTDQLVARLNAEPYTTPDGRTLTGDSVISVLYALTYTESRAPLLVDVIANGLAGDYGLIAQLLPIVDAGLEVGAIYAIRCNDFGTRRVASEYLPLDEIIGARHPRFFGRFYLAYRLATCSQWPAADPPFIRNITRQMDVPVLLVMNDFDPATPPADMRLLAHALGMEQTIVRYQGGGHTFPKNNACVLGIFGAYLFDLTVPAPGSTCPGQPISFAPREATLQTQAIDEDVLWGMPSPLP